MSVATLLVQRFEPADAAARVAELRSLAQRAYRAQLLEHPFTQQLRAGTLSRDRIRGFLLNHWTFSLEINTAKSYGYHRWLPFLKRHPEIYDLIVEQLADELAHPGPGGHIRIQIPLLAAFDLTEHDCAEAILIPEARALIDCRVRYFLEAPLAETYAANLTEGSIGQWFGIWYHALTTHYGVTREQAAYFDVHHEADTMEHDSGRAHVMGNALIIQTCLEDGYRPERPGFTLESSVQLAADLWELFLDGILRRYPA
jgi:pyrroloquinoline quinone (PQQ) biosynthesis protein C